MAAAGQRALRAFDINQPVEQAMRLENERKAGEPVLSPMGVLKRANFELQAECDRWKRQAEESGSLFDLRRDTPEDIAGVLVETCAPKPGGEHRQGDLA